MKKLLPEDIKAVFNKLDEVMTENRDYLIKLDAAVGDGDLGITMAKGFKASNLAVKDIDEKDIGMLLMKAGMALASAAPSTMGTLVGSGFMKAGKELKGKEVLDLKDFAEAVLQFAEGIMLRGKAKPGEKTIIDSVYPAALALQNAVDSNKTFSEALSMAYDASLQGLEDTKSMKPQHGKQVVHREKSIGLYDPGATAGMLIIRTFKEVINKEAS